MNSKNKVFSLADVASHNNSKDCWVIINARVYDVTNFLNDHPGGDNVLLDVAGKDASEEFEEAGHGSAARLMLDEYYVGEVNHVKPFSGNSNITTPKSESYIKQQIIRKEENASAVNMSIKSITLLVSSTILGVVVSFALYKQQARI